nr:hypothetical protein [Nostoc sp. CreGUA01]
MHWENRSGSTTSQFNLLFHADIYVVPSAQERSPALVYVVPNGVCANHPRATKAIALTDNKTHKNSVLSILIR